ncbi:abl interactor 2-like isoform X3 [Scyliorhinus torazame]|uniref:abl interactor 2-like isoform X3 n=1 Tax=Scyliorhinus torazame TaxID=75743 RepID=UPI003B59D941
MAEMQSLLQRDIPADRQALMESSANLQKLAEYCETNYIQAKDKTKAFEETKAFAAQSLASVANQINNLAEKVVKLLDLQTLELSKMESSVNFISQKVEMHKEKVARREIGLLAVPKTTPRIAKIIPPTNPVQREKYTRKPIVFTILDDTGHGVKDMSNHVRVGTLSRRYGHTSTSSISSQGTLGRSTKAPRPVQPPVVPNVYSSPVTNSPPADGPPRLVDISKNRNSCGSQNMVMPVTVAVSIPPPPPPPPIACEPVTDCPPPPPPPDFMLDLHELTPPPPPPIDYLDEPQWIPANYIEKAVALYTYNKQSDGDLTFQEGEIIYVIAKNENGWFEGVINGLTGYFPSNYVQRLD